MIRELSREYHKSGIEVVILTKKWPNTLSDKMTYEGVKVFRILNAKTNDDFMEVVRWLKKHHREIKSDIIHVIGARRPLPLIALLLRYLWNVPLIVNIAGGDIPDKLDPFPGTVWEKSKATVYPVFDYTDSIICASKDTARDFRYFFPNITIPVMILYAGIDIELINKTLPETSADKYIISLRRLDPTKGVDVLIKSFFKINKIYSNLRLIIAGDGSELNKLKKLVCELKLVKKVDFIGPIELTKAISLLKSAELTVVPSLSESGGLINIEAQASGCPVVATRVGGIPEYVLDQVSGLLCEPNNIEDLTGNILKILEDKLLKNNLIRGGYIHAKKFDWKTLAPQYLLHYKDLIRRFKVKKMCQDELFLRMWYKLIS